MAVFVWDKNKQPLMPCSEKRARLLLERGRAVVHKRYPFTIRLKDRVGGETQPLRLSIDPGSKITGLALMRETNREQRYVLCLLELVHRGYQIKKGLQQRAAFRRRRRGANLRYRAPRFNNRTKPKGWLAPSLQHRVDTIMAWVKRLSTLTPITAISQEWVLLSTLKTTGLPVTMASGGRTKYNRQRLGVPKTHALDAACVGTFDTLLDWQVPTLTIKAMGRGSYQRTRLTPYGFPRGYLMRQKQVHGFQTGDMVKAVVPTGKKAGTHTGRVAVRKTGSFNIQTEQGAAQGISHKHCTLIQRGDGYGYHLTPSINQRGGAGQAVA